MILELESKKQKSSSRLTTLLTRSNKHIISINTDTTCKNDNISNNNSNNVVNEISDVFYSQSNINSIDNNGSTSITTSITGKRTREYDNNSNNSNNSSSNNGSVSKDHKINQLYDILNYNMSTSTTTNDNSNNTILWETALSIFNDNFDYNPLENFTPHVPLRQVCFNEGVYIYCLLS